MPKTHVDNAYNRSHGRVGMEHGTAVISRGASSSGSAGFSSSYNVGASSSVHTSCYNKQPAPKVYVDNSFNRKHERVGLEHGQAVISHGSSGISGISKHEPIRAWENDPRPLKLYRDNSLNRRIGRAGMPVGTAVFSSGSKISDGTHQETYIDNKMNQKSDRVGMPRGCLPHNPCKNIPTYRPLSPNDIYSERAFKKISNIGLSENNVQSTHLSKKQTTPKHTMKTFGRSTSSDDDDESTKSHFYTQKFQQHNLKTDSSSSSSSDDNEESTKRSIYTRTFQQHKKETDSSNTSRGNFEIATRSPEKRTGQRNKTDEPARPNDFLHTDVTCVKIGAREIQIGQKIGSGEYGDVYFGKLNGTVVAIKKVRIKGASKRRLDMYSEKVLNLDRLHHHNIVKSIGACVDSPDLILVMEYMEMKLDDGLDFMDETQRLDILVQISSGLAYLHQNDVVHSELKSQNVHIMLKSDDRWIAKIAGFGLSMIRAETETMMSGKEYQVQNIDTARYSAPEILRGEMLSLRKLMKADVYSFGLIMFEVIYQKHAFQDLSLIQLRKRVGGHGLKLSVPPEKNVNKVIRDIMRNCWVFEADKRPDAIDVFEFLENQMSIYN